MESEGFSGFELGGYDPDAVHKKFAFEASSVSRVFQQHPQGHYEMEQSDPPNAHTEHAVNTLRGLVGSNLLGETEEVVENIVQHKYATLANASYDWFNSKGDKDFVHQGLQKDYIPDLGGFRVDENLSNADNVVLHNPETGETHISYRGTTDNPVGRPKEFVNDWRINGERTLGRTRPTRLAEAEEQFLKVAGKYGKDNLSVSGHSLGGGISTDIGRIFDVEGHHFNPAITTEQVLFDGETTAEQFIYKTPLDFASPLAYHEDLNATVKIVNNLEGQNGVVETHSIDQFMPEPTAVGEGVVKVERQTLAKTLVKGGGAVVGAGLTAYQVGTDIADDLKQGNSPFETTADIGIDLGKRAEELAVDTEIVGASLALAPETMGLSLVVGAGAVIINDYVVEHLADDLKSEVPKVENFVKNQANKVKNVFNKIGSLF